MPKNAAEKYLGMTRTMKCGMKATIIAYRHCNDIDVKFENGLVREHLTSNAFKTGDISTRPRGLKKDYIEQTRMMNCGMNATCIAYRKGIDIDIQFENGFIRKHTSISSFKLGEISPKPFINGKKHYTGMTRTMNCGIKATIIEYRERNDIDIQFEDSTISKHKRIYDFNKGTIKPKQDYSAYYLGQTRIMNCGIKATIIKYKNARNIDVQFKDGTIHHHVTTATFNRGQIAHPTGILFNKYKINGVAFKFHDTTYFYVTYVENGKEVSEVMCIDDMKKNKNILNVTQKERLYNSQSLFI